MKTAMHFVLFFLLVGLTGCVWAWVESKWLMHLVEPKWRNSPDVIFEMHAVGSLVLAFVGTFVMGVAVLIRMACGAKTARSLWITVFVAPVYMMAPYGLWLLGTPFPLALAWLIGVPILLAWRVMRKEPQGVG